MAGSSDYACLAREILARLMFEMPPPGAGLLQPAAPAHAGPDYRTTRSLAPRLLSSSPGLGVRP